MHEKKFTNFHEYIAPELYSSFTVGPYRFIRLNAFSVPKPDSFILDEKQLEWLKNELVEAEGKGHRIVLFLHCYPSELKHGDKELMSMLQQHNVLLVDMGHTHYNEVNNDGRTMYSATRSTGQIEEGPFGYSVTTLDGNSVSWHFVPLNSPSLVAITHPVDARMVAERTESKLSPAQLEVHAKTWGAQKVKEVHVEINGVHAALHSGDGIFWKGAVDGSSFKDGSYKLDAIAKTEDGKQFKDSIQLTLGHRQKRKTAAVDHENTIGEWRERGLLGTQLGPNKNGKKW